MAKLSIFAFSWLTLATMISMIKNGESKCHLHNYVASCILDILEEHIEATAIVNHCHLPLDVTFLVSYANTTRHSWKYTFVVTNQNERVLIPGLLLPPAPHAPVFLYARVPEKLYDMHNSSFVAIEASFVAELKSNEWEEAEFLNHTIYIDTTDDCRFMKVGRDPIPWIIGGLFLVAIVFGLVGGVFCLYRKKKLEIDQLALVSSMEVGLPGAQPYQMEAVSDKTENPNPEDSANEIQHDDSVVTENESNGDLTAEMESNKDAVDATKTNSNGFGFGRLKEEKESVVIGNPAFQDDSASAPPRRIKKRKSSKRHATSTPIKESSSDTIPESHSGLDTPDSSLESEDSRQSNSCDNEPSSTPEHPLEDSSDDGMPVGQGARRKVRGGAVSSTLTGTASVVSQEAKETNNDSQKGL